MGLAEVFTAARPEVVIHHAAQIDVQTSLTNPLLGCQNQHFGNPCRLEQCREHGVRKLIYASSAAVYGTPQYLGVDESASDKAAILLWYF